MRFAAIAFLLITSALILQTQSVRSAPGDTTFVQTFTYGSPQEGTFLFPDSTHSWEKILMYYRLKCNPAQNPACGEWDYLTYSYLYDHTGKMDSNLYYQPSIVIPGATPDSLKVMLQPSFHYESGLQFQSIYTDSSNYQIHGVGGNTGGLGGNGDGPDGKSMFLFRAAELSASGMSAGNIYGIRMLSTQPQTAIEDLRISFAHTTQNVLDPVNPPSPVMNEVFHRDVSMDTIGAASLVFYQPFNWDGTSNLLMEFSYTAVEDSFNLAADDAGFVSNLSTFGPQHYLHFEPYNYANLGDIDALDATSEFTFEAWIRAGDFLNWGNIFMKKKTNSERIGMQLGGDGSVQTNTLYCLVGNGSNSYGYTANILPLNEWHHVAMVYDGSAANNSGRLKLYFDGVQQSLSFNGTIPAVTVSNVEELRLSASHDASWDGDMDEVRFWSKALSATEIQDRIYSHIYPFDPLWNDLLAYYPMNEGAGMMIGDESQNQYDGNLALPAWRNYGGDQFREFFSLPLRPSVGFEQGNLQAQSDTTFVVDSIPNDPIFIQLHDDPVQPTIASDTILGWPLSYHYTFDSTGVATDSVMIPADTLIIAVDYPYYGAPFEIVERYELGRYITPYGIGLDLGNGFTWIFDVTDFGPLLRDSVHLKAGNWQELLDMKFVMIEGTPPREVNKIEKLWNGNYNLSTFDTQVPPLKVRADPASDMYRVKITTTGHQFSNATNCAEFCYKIHSLDVDGTTRYDWQIMQECADNPLYPQGGTWIFDRAGWCPGAKARLHDIEITEWVNPGDSVEVDYNCDYDPYGNYVVESYLVSYSDPNFNTDASIEEIIAPSTMKYHGRFNPICGKPVVRIRNNGSDSLYSLTFNYGLCSQTAQSYTWNGALGFLEEVEVALPPVELFNYDATLDPCFSVEISQPNGQADEYPHNNAARSRFELPPDFENPFLFRFRTNHAPQESAWWIENMNGDTLFENGALPANTFMDDTIDLAHGCYHLMITDAGGDGLEFWYNMPPYGNGTAGYARVKSTQGGYYLYNFEPDFGNFIGTAFTIGHPVGTEEHELRANIEVFPNPAVDQGNLFISFSIPQNTDIGIFDISGRCIWQKQDDKVSNKLYRIPVYNFAPGSYIVRISTGARVFTRKLVVVE